MSRRHRNPAPGEVEYLASFCLKAIDPQVPASTLRPADAHGKSARAELAAWLMVRRVQNVTDWVSGASAFAASAIDIDQWCAGLGGQVAASALTMVNCTGLRAHLSRGERLFDRESLFAPWLPIWV